MFVLKILKCTSQDEYDHKRFIIKQQLDYYIITREKTGFNSEIFETKCNALKQMLAGHSVPQSSNWHFYHWAIWIRAEHGISTCSNHSEGFHSHISSLNSSNTGFPIRLTNLLKKVLKHCSNLKNNNGKSLRTKCINRRDYIIDKLTNSKGSYKDFCEENCDCGKSFYLSSLFGRPIPCKHEMLCPILQFIETLGLNEFRINEMIVTILKYDKESKIRNIAKKTDNILSEILMKYFSLRKKKEIVKKFIYTICICIYIKPEDILHIPLDFKNHHLEIIQSDKNLEIKANKRNYNNKTFLKFKFKQEDNEFWYHDIDSEIIKNSLKLKYETL